MKIPRKTNYKTVKRQRIRAAVNLHHWRKSFVGLHKTLGIFVKGIDIETGKYNWKDLTTVGYGCINPSVVVDMSNNRTYFLKNDGKLVFHEKKTPLNGEWKLYGIEGQFLMTGENGAFWGEPKDNAHSIDPLKSMKEDRDESFK